jgi:hypothetical protein
MKQKDEGAYRNYNLDEWDDAYIRRIADFICQLFLDFVLLV